MKDVVTVRRILVAELRSAGECRVAQALEDGEERDLDDRDLILLDAVLTGQGYLLNGKRIDPLAVEIIRWPERSRLLYFAHE